MSDDVRPIRILYFLPAYRSTMHPAVDVQKCRDMVWAAQAGIHCDQGWLDRLGIDDVRNWAVEQARSRGYDYLYMQDADTYSHGTEPVLKALLDVAMERDASIVAAGYGLRREVPALSVYPARPGEVYEGELAGTGMMLVDLRHVDRIAAEYEGPWFMRTYADARCTTLQVGGDAFFCDLVRRHGGTVWITAQVPTTHAYLDTDRLRFDPTAGASADSAVAAVKATTKD